MAPRFTPWSQYCSYCDYWGSTLQPVTQELERDEFLSTREGEDNPIGYLDDLRRRNFRTYLRRIVMLRPPVVGPLLEVGCGAGLFLSECTTFGIEAEGIEAYEAMARRGIKEGRKIRIGLFPDCLREDERFGAIVFNDVFEHLPDAREMLLTCNRHLVPGGILVINVPNSHGLFFRVAALAFRVKVVRLWTRMWQKMFWSPHLHYFSPRSLEALCSATGFEPATPTIRLTSVSVRGLWSRIRADSNTSTLVGMAIYAGSLCLVCIAPIFESDCIVRIFRKPV